MGIGGTTDHRSITPLKRSQTVVREFKTTIEFDQQPGTSLFQLQHPIMLQRRDGAVLFRIETFQPGLAGMNGKTACTS